ncbi:MAG: hypothetical protein SGILL_001180 [Bacillariaceae sp.]
MDAAAAAAAFPEKMIMDDIHPPNIVTLSPVLDEEDTVVPHPDSPLSTPPDSPRPQTSDEESVDGDIENAMATALALPERPTRRRTAELLEDRPRSSLALPIMASSLKQEIAVAVEAEKKVVTAEVMKPIEIKVTTSVPAMQKKTAASSAHKRPQKKKNLPMVDHDDDAPDDEKKVDDFPLRPTASKGGAVWMEEPDEHHHEMDEMEIMMNEQEQEQEPMIISTSRRSTITNFDNSSNNSHLRSTASNTLSASLKTSSFHTAESAAAATFDELITEEEPPSLQHEEPPRLSIGGMTPIKTSPEEDGELPSLTSPPPASPPTHLDLASPDSSTAFLSLDAAVTAETSPEEDGELPKLSSPPPPSPPMNLDLASPESSTIEDADVTATASEEDGWLPTLSSPAPPSPPMNLDLASPDSTVDVSLEQEGQEKVFNADMEIAIIEDGEPPALSPTPAVSAADAPWQSKMSLLSRSYSSGMGDASAEKSKNNETLSLSPEKDNNAAKLKDVGSSAERSKPTGYVPTWKRTSSLDDGEKKIDGNQEVEPAILATSEQRPSGMERGRTFSGTSTTNSNKFVGVDREQHVKFVALKRDILSRQQSLPTNPTSTHQSEDESALAPVRSLDSSGTAQMSLLADPSINDQAPSVVVTPDEETDAVELSIMVSPDGEIDYSKTILNVMSSEELNKSTSSSSGAVESPKEVGDPVVTNDDTKSQDAVVTKETISESNSSPAGKQHDIRTSRSNGDSSSAGSKASGYSPPNQAWSDYLTFRGVPVESPSKNAAYDISEIGKAWVNGGDASPTKITNTALASSAATEGEISPQKPSVDAFKAAFRDMTPNKDLQGSEKSSGWLEEELSRRAFVKREINNAIEERGKVMQAIGSDDISSKSKPRSDSVLSVDEEVAAITGEDEKVELLHSLVQSPSDGRIPGNGSMDEAPPRQLFGMQEDVELVQGFAPFDTSTESEEGHGPAVVYDDMQVEMKKFASDTRAALRDQSFTEQALAASASKFVPVSALSPVAGDPSASVDGPSVESSGLPTKTIDPLVPEPSPSTVQSKTSRAGSKSIVGSHSIEFADLQSNQAPVLIRSMDCFDGVAKGDITLSLLSENTGSGETSVGATWANRVKGAIWRSRRMRRSIDGPAAQGRSPLPVDVDSARVSGTYRTVASTQDAALIHLKNDEIDEAIELFEDIIFAYYSYFEKSLSLREKNPGAESGVQSVDFQLYIGVALHNLGVLNLLKGEYVEALSFFTRAAENRKSHLGEGHPDHISSLVKVATCRYAINEFAEAHARLEEALVYAKRSCITIDDRMMVAEILNNLGCLAYMCGQPVAANSFYRDSMDIQFGVLSDSLYAGNATWGRSISLNISITRANIGFVKLVTKELPVAITALENALMEQQILLRGAHDTIIATMDHVAVANILHNDQEKAAMMFRRILELQQNEYGPHDRRCYVTVDKINMVQSKGAPYEEAVEALHKTFTMPAASQPINEPVDGVSKANGSKGRRTKARSVPDPLRNRPQKNKVMKVLNSIRKKKP